ncbi:MAG: hypothetical protein ACK4ND_13895, partial [Cytophagaceae bacterium]
CLFDSSLKPVWTKTIELTKNTYRIEDVVMDNNKNIYFNTLVKYPYNQDKIEHVIKSELYIYNQAPEKIDIEKGKYFPVSLKIKIENNKLIGAATVTDNAKEYFFRKDPDFDVTGNSYYIKGMHFFSIDPVSRKLKENHQSLLSQSFIEENQNLKSKNTPDGLPAMQVKDVYYTDAAGYVAAMEHNSARLFIKTQYDEYSRNRIYESFDAIENVSGNVLVMSLSADGKSNKVSSIKKYQTSVVDLNMKPMRIKTTNFYKIYLRTDYFGSAFFFDKGSLHVIFNDKPGNPELRKAGNFDKMEKFSKPDKGYIMVMATVDAKGTISEEILLSSTDKALKSIPMPTYLDQAYRNNLFTVFAGIEAKSFRLIRLKTN